MAGKDCKMAEKIRWGIMVTGYIAGVFAEGLSWLSNAELVAVGSRSASSADRFADRYDIPHRHSSYKELAHDPEVDVVYIATPHPFHKDHILFSLSAGKAVLCEKPLTINASESKKVIRAARDRNLFLMEAMWSRFLPAVAEVRNLLSNGVIGDVLILNADFGFQADANPQGRLYNPALAVGALLDVGVYPVSLAFMIFGPPARITSLAYIGETGVDEQAGILFGYENGALAESYVTIKADSPTEATRIGSKGRLHLHAQAGLFRPYKPTLSLEGKEDRIIDVPYEGNGYHYEAAEVMSCLRTGKTEHDYRVE
jgi:predicted dehydrogenase